MYMVHKVVRRKSNCLILVSQNYKLYSIGTSWNLGPTQSTKGDIESVRKDCHNLKGDTHCIRGATETIKSLNLALSLEHQTILGEGKTAREDVQQVSITLHGVKYQLKSVAGDVRTLKVDLATVQRDVFALKGMLAASVMRF